MFLKALLALSTSLTRHQKGPTCKKTKKLTLLAQRAVSSERAPLCHGSKTLAVMDLSVSQTFRVRADPITPSQSSNLTQRKTWESETTILICFHSTWPPWKNKNSTKCSNKRRLLLYHRVTSNPPLLSQIIAQNRRRTPRAGKTRSRVAW